MRGNFVSETSKPGPDATPESTDPPTAKLSPGGRLLLLAGSIGPLGHMPASGTVAVAVAGVPLCWLMKRYLSNEAFLIMFVKAAPGCSRPSRCVSAKGLNSGRSRPTRLQ